MAGGSVLEADRGCAGQAGRAGACRPGRCTGGMADQGYHWPA